MPEIMIALIAAAALVGALAGGAIVWHWTSEATVEAPPAPAAAATPELDMLDHELERARRYERPFSLIRLPVDHDPDTAATEEEARAVFGSLRTIDASWVDDDGVMLLLPEVGRAEGEACLQRLRELAPGLTRGARLAVFPEDGMTRGSLIDKVHAPDAQRSPSSVVAFMSTRMPRWTS